MITVVYGLSVINSFYPVMHTFHCDSVTSPCRDGVYFKHGLLHDRSDIYDFQGKALGGILSFCSFGALSSDSVKH
jgi:hypothetical protein